LSKNMAFWKASFLQLRIYLLCVLGFAAAGLLANIIVFLSVGSSDDNTQVSTANIITIFLILMASVLPLSFYKRMINLGSTRKEYYVGMIVVFTIWTVIFAIFNIVSLMLEKSVLKPYQTTLNILQVFNWDQFGAAGMFVYQFGAYMLLISLLSLLFSSLRHVAGWVIWVALIAAIPIFTSIAPLRHKLASGLQTLLFNDSLLQGFVWTFLLSCVFLAVGWWFTTRRTF
jgi:hypothetical protein